MFHIATLSTAALAVAPPLRAASASKDSFGASATAVNVGETVDFRVQFGAATNWAGGGSNPIEPTTSEGYQA